MRADRARRRAGFPIVAAAAVLALGAARAEAHAVVSPVVGKAKELQLYSLSVPTEKENATTSQIELDVPPGFAIDSFQAAPGWKRHVVAKGTGEEAVVQRVVWTGGRTPTGEDSVFAFNATPTSDKTYTFRVRQTYSDGSVVDWSGPESSDAPAPKLEALSSFDSGGSNTLGIIALVVAGISFVLAGVSLAGHRTLT
jgi:uncharacterized protein YcnI